MKWIENEMNELSPILFYITQGGALGTPLYVLLVGTKSLSRLNL